MKKKVKYSKVLVAVIVTLNIIFTAAVLFVFYHTGNEPVALVTAWFGTWTAEMLALAGIKRMEIRKENEL